MQKIAGKLKAESKNKILFAKAQKDLVSGQNSVESQVKKHSSEVNQYVSKLKKLTNSINNISKQKDEFQKKLQKYSIELTYAQKFLVYTKELLEFDIDYVKSNLLHMAKTMEETPLERLTSGLDYANTLFGKRSKNVLKNTESDKSLVNVKV